MGKRVRRSPDETIGGNQRAPRPEDCEASRKTDIRSVWSNPRYQDIGQCSCELMASGGGYGSGGRGAALLQALNQPPRTPGEDTAQAFSANGNGQQAPIAPVGRGAFLAGLMQQQQAGQPAGVTRTARAGAPVPQHQGYDQPGFQPSAIPMAAQYEPPPPYSEVPL